jgi:hypothetical protein
MLLAPADAKSDNQTANVDLASLRSPRTDPTFQTRNECGTLDTRGFDRKTLGSPHRACSSLLDLASRRRQVRGIYVKKGKEERLSTIPASARPGLDDMRAFDSDFVEEGRGEMGVPDNDDIARIYFRFVPHLSWASTRRLRRN